MSIDQAALKEAVGHYQALLDELGALEHLVRDLAIPDGCVVYRLPEPVVGRKGKAGQQDWVGAPTPGLMWPMRGPDDVPIEGTAASDPDELPDEPIPVSPVRGREAIELSFQVLQQLRRRVDQDPVQTLRLPGILWLRPSPALKGLVLQVNQRKDALRDAVRRVAPRPRTMRAVLAGTDMAKVHLLQAYRHVMHLTPGVRKVSFCWISGGSTVSTWRVGDLRERYSIEDNLSPGSSSWETALIGLTDEDQVALVKRPPPYPTANVVWMSDRRLRLSSGLPFLIAQDQPPEVLDLESYDGGGPRRQRKRVVLKDAPLIDRPRVHAYRSGCSPEERKSSQ